MGRSYATGDRTVYSYRIGRVLAGSLLTGALMIGGADAQSINYVPLNYDNMPTFLTGIRGNTITGQYVIPNGGGNGGLIYNISSGTWIPFPVATSNGVNFPGAIDDTPYGPSFGSDGGILRVVGSYQTASSAPYDLSYLYDSAAKAGQNITYLQYPNPPGDTTLFTIAHSTFGDQLVGNYDTKLTAGDSFVYQISTGSYTTTDKPGAYSTTAYGIWGNEIAGGYFDPGVGGGPGPGHAFLYNETTGVWTRYDYPNAAETHFEGITSGGQANTYNLAVDYVDTSGVPHAAVLHIDAAGNTTWIDLGIAGETVSSNSIYQNEVLGVEVSASGGVKGYTALIPGIYNPITNNGTLAAAAPGSVAMAGAAGDDVLNNGTLTARAAFSTGLSADTYGVVTNNGQINATGPASAAVQMNGLEGTLINNGILRAAPGSFAITTGATALGSIAVNAGTIDGQVDFAAGPLARFENSGWLGISAPGVGVRHVFSGVFAQTGAGTLSLRIAANGSNDSVQAGGLGLLGGNLILAPQGSGFQPGTRYTVVTAAGGISGSFASAALSGIALLAPVVSYGAFDATVTLAQESAAIVAVTPNQTATAIGLDAAIAASPTVQSAVDQLSVADLQAGLNRLSGESYTGAETAAVDTGAAFTTQISSQMNLIRRITAGGGDAEAAGYGGGRTQLAASSRWSMWLQGYGQSDAVPGDGNASQLNSTLAGMSAGLDNRVSEKLTIGGAFGYVSDNFSVDGSGAQGHTNNAQFAVYGIYSLGQAFLDGVIGYSHASGSVQRDISVPGFGGQATGSVSGNQALGSVQTGYDFSLCRNGNLVLTPFAGLQFTSYAQNGVNESGGPLSLSVQQASANSVTSRLGGQFATILHLGALAVSAQAQLGWAHEYASLNRSITASFTGTGTAFTVSGAEAYRNHALTGLGLATAITSKANLYLRYDGALNGGNSAEAISGGFRYIF